MNEENRINELKDAGRVHGARFKPVEEPLSSKQLFRIAAELQEFLIKRKPQTRRIVASASLTHYVE
jgi:hypothetical protein